MKKRKINWLAVIFIAFAITVALMGGFAKGAVNVNTPAVKSVTGDIRNNKAADSVYALVLNSYTGVLAISDTGITGGAFGFIRFKSSDSTWQFSVDSGTTWSYFNSGASQSDIGDTATVLRAEIGAAGGGDITGAVQGTGITLGNASGPGDITIGANMTYFRSWIDTLNQVHIPLSDSTTYTKGFQVHNTTSPTTNGASMWDGDDFELHIGNGSTYETIKEVPDSSATAGNFAADAMAAFAARNSGSNGYVPVYRPSSDSGIVWEAQVGTGGGVFVSDSGGYDASNFPPYRQDSISFEKGFDVSWGIPNFGGAYISLDLTENPVLLNTAQTLGTLPQTKGGIGKSSWTPYTFLYGNNTSTPVEVGPLDSGEVLVGQSTTSAPTPIPIVGSNGIDVDTYTDSMVFTVDYSEVPCTLSTNTTGTLTSSGGGTGLSDPTADRLLITQGSGDMGLMDIPNGYVVTGSDTGLAAVKLTDSTGSGMNITEGSGVISFKTTLGTTIDSTEIPAGAVSLSDIDADPGTDGQVPTVSSGVLVYATPSADLLTSLTNGDSAGFGFIPASGDSFNVFIDTDSVFVSAPGKDMFFGNAGDSLLLYDPILNGSLWPADSGTDGQVLTTDGDGTLSWGDAGAATVTLESVFNLFDPGYVDTVGNNDSIHVIASDSAVKAGLDGEGNTITTYYSTTTHNHSGIYIGDSVGTVTGTNLEDSTVQGVDIAQQTIGAKNIANGAIADSLLDLGTDADNFNMLDMYGPTANRLWYSNSGGAMAALAAGTEGQILKKGATNPEWGSETDPTLTDDEAVTIGNSGDADPTLSFDNPDGSETITYYSSGTDEFLFSKGVSLLAGNFTLSLGNIVLSNAGATVDGVDISALNTDLAADSASWNAAADDFDTNYVKLNADTLDADSGAIVRLTVDTLRGVDSASLAGVTIGDIAFEDTVQTLIGAYVDTSDLQFTIWDPEGITDTIPIFYADSAKYPFGIKILSLSCQTNVDGAYELKFFSFTAADPPVLHDYIDTLNVGASDQRVSSETFEDADASSIDIGQQIYILPPTTDIDWLKVTIRYYVRKS